MQTRFPVLLAALCLTASTWAQRESFDASTIRRSDAIAKKFAPKAAPSAGDQVTRSGADAQGRPLSVTATRQAVSFDNIFFEFDSAKLRDHASELQLAEIASALEKPELRGSAFLIEGHTCDLGEAGYNMKLSAARAQTVKDFLVKRGVSAGRLLVLGFGENEPAVKAPTEESPAEAERKRAQNRRVVLRLRSVENLARP